MAAPPGAWARAALCMSAVQQPPLAQGKYAMKLHRFRLGQMVHLASSRDRVPASAEAYKIVRLMPSEGYDACYRIKAASEAFERVVKESEISLRTLA